MSEEYQSQQSKITNSCKIPKPQFHGTKSFDNLPRKMKGAFLQIQNVISLIFKPDYGSHLERIHPQLIFCRVNKLLTEPNNTLSFPRIIVKF